MAVGIDDLHGVYSLTIRVQPEIYAVSPALCNLFTASAMVGQLAQDEGSQFESGCVYFLI
jgi:hypothetical protein